MSADGTVLVTGASGYVGKRLCAMLGSKGIPVRALYRRKDPPGELVALAEHAADSGGSRGSTFELARGDLGSEADARRAVDGVAAVIHAAALARDWGPAAAFRAANVEATARLARAASAAGVREFILVGSVAVHGFGHHESSTEEGPYYPLDHPYPASKLEAERIVLAMDGPGFRTSSIRLGYVYGPGDTTSTYRMFDAAVRGAFGYIGEGSRRTSVVYVDDACAALGAALGNEAVAGQAVNVVSGEAIAWSDFADVVYGTLGLLPRPRRLPRALALVAARALEAAYRLAGSVEGPPLTTYRVRRSTVDYVFSNAKARHLLGFSPVTAFPEGLRLAAEAYLSRRSPSRDP